MFPNAPSSATSAVRVAYADVDRVFARGVECALSGELRGKAVSPATDYVRRMLARVVAARPHRVLCMIAGVWLLNAFDLVFTVLAHQQGFLVEVNPVACCLLEWGAAWIIAYKIILVAAGSYPMVCFRTAPVAEFGAFVVFVCYFVLAAWWSECYKLYAVVGAIGCGP